MSLPVVLPGSCCPVPGASQLAEASHRTRPRGLSAGGGSRLLLPGRPLLSLGLLQLLLGGSMVALSFGAVSLSSSPSIRNSCPFWAGFSVILLGVVGLTTWRRPMLLLVNVFVLLSVVCVLLNVAGFILCCQGAQLVSGTDSCRLSEEGDVCYCCRTSKCAEKMLLELQPASSCSTTRVLLKKVLFALCALNALTTAVCLMAAALRYLQIFTTRTPCMFETRTVVEDREEPAQIPDPDEFVAPAPPPSYFSTFYSSTPRLARQMLGNSVIPLPHIYGARIKGVEVFYPMEPPPAYEAVAKPSCAVTQEAEFTVIPTTTPSGASVPCDTHVHISDTSPRMVSVSSGHALQAKPQLQPPPQQRLTPTCSKRAGIHRSSSDPVLMNFTTKVWSSCDDPLALSPHTTDSSTQTSQSTLATQTQGQVTLRRSKNSSRTACRPRPSSMVDYHSYRHTQQLVRKILEQPAAQGLAPEVQELVDSIRNVLQSDQEHMEEAVRCASYIEQAFTESETSPIHPKNSQQQPRDRSSHTFPRLLKRRPGLLHLKSCGDLSSFTFSALQVLEHGGNCPKAVLRAGSRLDQADRPHSLIGVFRETML